MTSMLSVATIVISSLAATPDASQDLFIVVDDATPVRSGPGSDHYPFLMAAKGTPVRVTGSVEGMARIAAEGPLFDQAWGIIRYPVDGTPPLNDQWEVTRNNLEVFAPRMDDSNWASANGWICALPTGTKVEVLATSTERAGTPEGQDYTVHTVRIPSTGRGWIDESQLHAAPQEAIDAFNRGWTEAPRWMMSTPTSPLADWSTWADQRPEWIAFNTPVEPIEEVAVVEEVVEPVIAEVPEGVTEETYQNEAWDRLEQSLAATPLYTLDSKAVAQLRAGYIDIIDQEATAHPELAEQATIRVKQLDLAASINATRSDIAAAKTQIMRSKEDLTAQQRLLDESPDYVVRGKLAISPVFDGVDRPIMYRLQDPFSGRSLAYVSPESDVDIRGMLGQRVGIVGRVVWNDQWQVRMIEPVRVDLVSVSPPQ